MEKMVHRAIILAITLLMIVGCAKEGAMEETATTEQSRVVSFTSSSSLTRVDSDGEVWEDGDALGITMWCDGEIYSKYKNIKYIANVDAESGVITFAPEVEREAMLYPRDTIVSFSAYYPYTVDIDIETCKSIDVGQEMTYSADLSETDDLGAIDLLFATSDDYSDSSSGDVTLSFDHMLSRFEIYVVHTLDDIETLEGLTVTLSNVVTQAIYYIGEVDLESYTTDCKTEDLELNVIVGSGETTAKIVALLNPNLFYYEDVLTQMTYYDTASSYTENYMKIEDATLTFTIPNGSMEQQVYTTDTFNLNPQRGKVHRYYVELGNDIITFIGENEIVDWVASDGDVPLDDIYNQL